MQVSQDKQRKEATSKRCWAVLLYAEFAMNLLQTAKSYRSTRMYMAGHANRIFLRNLRYLSSLPEVFRDTFFESASSQ